jgi:hypothetical protein
MILGFLVLSPIVIPCLLVLSGPFVLYQWMSQKLDDSGVDCGFCWSLMLFVMVCLPLGILFDPIVWIGGLIYFLPEICEEIC